MADTGHLKDTVRIGVRVGKVINKRRVAKHFTAALGEGSFTWARDQASIDTEAALDGIYVLRTPVPEAQLPAPAAVAAVASTRHLGPEAALAGGSA